MLVGYGCTTCIGNSGPLPDDVSAEIDARRPGGRVGAERQQEFRRPHSAAGARELPGVAAARRRLRAGRHDESRPDDRTAGEGQGRQAGLPPRHLADRARNPGDDAVGGASEQFGKQYADVFLGDERWQQLAVPTGDRFAWDPTPPTFAIRRFSRTCTMEPAPLRDITGARVLAMLGDSITTDHISPAGSIKKDSPAGKYLMAPRRAAARLQFVRRPARQSRGDDARHVRQHPAAQSDGARAPKAAVTTYLPGRRGDDDLRRRDEIQGCRRAAARARRQGVRVGIVARLGGQGHAAPRRQGRHRRELRAHPPEQPGQHGRAAAAVSGRAVGVNARLDRSRAIRGDGRGRRPAARRSGERSRATDERQDDRIQRARANRYAGRAGRLQARRHPAVRAPPAGGERPGRPEGLH